MMNTHTKQMKQQKAMMPTNFLLFVIKTTNSIYLKMQSLNHAIKLSSLHNFIYFINIRLQNYTLSIIIKKKSHSSLNHGLMNIEEIYVVTISGSFKD